MATASCKSKYHVGDRNVDVSLFRIRNGRLLRRCIECERKTSAAYQRTPNGRHVKSLHYVNNIESYRATSLRSKQTLINLDGGVSYLYRNAKRRAGKYGLSFSIELSDVVIPKVCPVLNIPMFFSDTRTDNTPSLDRIDNTRGYEPDNIKVISCRANYMKRDLTFEEVVKLYTYLKEHTNGS